MLCALECPATLTLTCEFAECSIRSTCSRARMLVRTSTASRWLLLTLCAHRRWLLSLRCCSRSPSSSSRMLFTSRAEEDRNQKSHGCSCFGGQPLIKQPPHTYSWSARMKRSFIFFENKSKSAIFAFFSFTFDRPNH